MSLLNRTNQDGYLKRLKRALNATRQEFKTKMDVLFGNHESPISPEQFEELEYLLIGADLGFETTMNLVEKKQQHFARV